MISLHVNQNGQPSKLFTGLFMNTEAIVLYIYFKGRENEDFVANKFYQF